MAVQETAATRDEPPADGSAAQRPCPMCGKETSSSAPQCEFCGERLAVARADASPRPSVFWIGCVCALLLCASTINYMDRQTLSNTAKEIKDEFQLSNALYGRLEVGFGWAFAVGATVFGVIADRTNIRWLYPGVLLAWSLMGFATGYVETYAGLLTCRLLLGIFESGHWPCALKTTQRLLPPQYRTLGNSVLQSGTAIGAIITPLIIKWMMTDQPGSWRWPFQIIGLIGIGWVVLWLATIRGRELAPQPAPAVADPAAHSAWEFLSAVCSRRFATLFVVVILINTCYQLYRVWLPLFLREGRGYSKDDMLDFVFWFYIANDVGCLGAGFLTAWLHRVGWRVHTSRLVVFTFCAMLTSLSLLVPYLAAGYGLFATLLLVSMGALGIFPCYYSFSQELSIRHQGKITGLLGTSAWLVASPLQEVFGRWVDQTGRHDWGLAFVGLLPLVGAMAIAVGWGRDPETESHAAAGHTG